MRASSTLLAIAVLLIAAAPASAGGTLAPQDVWATMGGPVFSGERVMWASERGDNGGGLDFHIAAPDGSDHRHWGFTAPTGVAGFDDHLSLGASADRMAAGLNVYGCFPACKYQYFQTLYAGMLTAPTGEAPAEFQKACGGGAFYASNANVHAVDVSADVVAYEPCPNQVVVRDFSAPPPGTSEFPGVRPRIAGSFLAVSEGPAAEPYRPAPPRELVLRRWGNGEVLLRVTGSPSPFDVQPDGKVAFLRGQDGEQVVAWASPASPDPKRVGTAAGTVRSLRIAADRVAWEDAGGAHVHALDGAVVAASPRAAVGDFDGTRLAWATRPCALLAIATWDLQGEPPSLPDAPCPIAALASPTLRAKYTHSASRVRVELSCPAEPALGCAGGLSMWGRDMRKRPNTFYHPDGRVDLAHGSYRLKPGETRAVDLLYGKRRVCIGLRSALRPLLRVTGGGRTERYRVDVVGLRRAIAWCEGRATLPQR